MHYYVAKQKLPLYTSGTEYPTADATYSDATRPHLRISEEGKTKSETLLNQARKTAIARELGSMICYMAPVIFLLSLISFVSTGNLTGAVNLHVVSFIWALAHCILKSFPDKFILILPGKDPKYLMAKIFALGLRFRLATAIVYCLLGGRRVSYTAVDVLFSIVICPLQIHSRLWSFPLLTICHFVSWVVLLPVMHKFNKLHNVFHVVTSIGNLDTLDNPYGALDYYMNHTWGICMGITLVLVNYLICRVERAIDAFHGKFYREGRFLKTTHDLYTALSSGDAELRIMAISHVNYCLQTSDTGYVSYDKICVPNELEPMYALPPNTTLAATAGTEGIYAEDIKSTLLIVALGFAHRALCLIGHDFRYRIEYEAGFRKAPYLSPISSGVCLTPFAYYCGSDASTSNTLFKKSVAFIKGCSTFLVALEMLRDDYKTHQPIINSEFSKQLKEATNTLWVVGYGPHVKLMNIANTVYMNDKVAVHIKYLEELVEVLIYVAYEAILCASLLKLHRPEIDTKQAVESIKTYKLVSSTYNKVNLEHFFSCSKLIIGVKMYC